MPTIRNKELHFLLEELGKAAPTHVVEFGAIDGRFGVQVAEAFPQVQVSLVVDSLRIADEIAARSRAKTHSNLEVVLADGLASLSRDPEVVVLRPSGREGHARMEARFAETRRALPSGGTAVLVGEKHHGAEAMTRMMARWFPETAVVWRHGGVWIAIGQKRDSTGRGPETAPGISHAVDYSGHSFRFRTLPTLFSKAHADPGSLLLLDVLTRASEPMSGPVLDMGCGYGLVGVILAKLFPGLEFILSDVELPAVDSANKNIALNGVVANARAVVAGGASAVAPGQCGTIVSHLPLHVARGELTRMLESARKALRDDGAFYSVFLAEYALDAHIRTTFGNCEVLAEQLMAGQDSYRVCRAVKASRP